MCALPISAPPREDLQPLRPNQPPGEGRQAKVFARGSSNGTHRGAILPPQAVGVADLPQVPQSSQEVVGAHFRAPDVMPHLDGELVDRAGGAVAAPALDEAGDDLDVENPAGEEGAGEDLAQVVAGAEDLRA